MNRQWELNDRVRNMFDQYRRPGRRAEDGKSEGMGADKESDGRIIVHGGIVVTGNGCTVNIGDTDRGGPNKGDECTIDASKLQMHRMLQELQSLTATLRELIDQVRRLAPGSAWSQRLKGIVNRVESTISNHLSRAPILATSICRAIFDPPPWPQPQSIVLTADPIKSGPIPLYPAFINPFVGAQPIVA